MSNYNDLINLTPPKLSLKHKMPLYERAAQFAPFAALTGFDEQIGEEARFTGSRPAVCDEDAQIINENLNILLSSRERLCVRLTYFVPDSSKSGGVLIKKEGEVRRVDAVLREVIFTDKTVVPIDEIFALDIR